MENGELINNINSRMILNYIFNYIEDKNFKDKLFLYSKKLQNQLNIKLIRIKENYLKKIKFDLDKYFFIEPSLFKKDCLAKEYNKYIIENKLNKETIENIISDIYENKEIKNIEEDVGKIEDHKKLINIESPLFKILSKTKNFSKIFTIHIPQNIIDEYKLKEDYIKFFDNLNQLDIKYSSIYYDLVDVNKINYLKEFNINFNKIKRLILKIENNSKEKYDNNIQINKFFGSLFSFNNIKNNLIYLEIDIDFMYDKINNELLENINNFKLLRYLYLYNLKFKQDFIIKLKEIELLSIKSSKNVKLSEIPNEKLIELYLSPYEK